ncbi:CdaR family transcriptional regulator, partial [Rhodococcus erythropolis]
MHSTDKSVIELLESPEGLDVEIRSIALVESSDIDGTDSRGAISDIYLPVGVPESTLTQWLRKFEGRPARRRPKLLLVKNAREATTVLTAARNIGIAVAAVHPQASSGHVYSLVLRLLTQSMYRSRAVAGAVAGGDSDLFALSETIAELTGGLVTIDDTALHVIAYSSAHEGEDELRQLSILGREWPIEYTEWIESRGVFEHLRRSDEVISLPSEPSIGAAQRLAVSITRPDLSAPTGSVAHQHNLGSIWVQRA